jgi:cytochrome c biogenesis protein CcdA
MNKSMEKLLLANYCLAYLWSMKERRCEVTVFFFSNQIFYIICGFCYALIGYFTRGLPAFLTVCVLPALISYFVFYREKKYFQKQLLLLEIPEKHRSLTKKEKKVNAGFALITLVLSFMIFILLSIVFFSGYGNK